MCTCDVAKQWIEPPCEEPSQSSDRAGKQYKMFTLVVRDEEEGSPDKMGVFDNSNPLDNPETRDWLGPSLRKMTKGKKPNEYISNFPSKKFRQAFRRAGQGLHLYQPRHGGASDDLCKGLRDHAGVKARGRWRTDRCCGGMPKVGKIQSLLKQMSEWSLSYCKRSMTKIEAVVKGSLPLHS